MEAKRVKLIYCASENMIADLLTKDLPIKQFEKLRELGGVGKCTHCD